MDTKSKKSRLYSKGFKATAVFLILAMTVTFILSLVGIYWATSSFTYGIEMMLSGKHDGYTQTYEFRNDFNTLIEEAVYVNLYYKSEGYIREGGVTDEEQMIQEFKDYYGIVDGVITSSTEIVGEQNNNYSVVLIESIPMDLEDNFFEYATLVEEKLRGYKGVYIQNHIDSYKTMKRDLDSYHNFYYYIEGPNGKTAAGNADKDFIMNLNQHIVLDRDFVTEDTMKIYTGVHNDIISEGEYTLYAGVSDVFMPGDEMYEKDISFQHKKDAFPYFIFGSIASVLVALALLIYLMGVTGQSERGGQVQLAGIDRVYNDIHFTAVLLAAVVSFMCLAALVNTSYYYYYEGWYYGFIAGVVVLAVVDMSVAISFLCSMSRHIKAKTLIRHTLIATVFIKLGEAFTKRSLTTWVILLFIIYSAVLFSINEGILAMALVFAAVLLLTRNLKSLTRIMSAAKSTSKGDYESIDVSKITPTFNAFATDVNNIQNGLKYSVSEAVKGERMKADLITNVSHDLKTPLTSIISYVDLLDREQLNHPVAEGYVDVLVEKSQRLKQLIEDLIEASKASSGSLPVEKSKINLKDLLIQACGEFEEKATAAKIEFRITTKGEIYIDADGKHMWRIYENLLSNVIKYAMANTRVYIDIRRENNYGVMTMKNISQNEIQVNVENLAERFVRGDSSRTTEGSGLGLSIAKSLTVLQGGRFDIAVDGDMFKVRVAMPIHVEKTESKPVEEIKPEEKKEKTARIDTSLIKRRKRKQKDDDIQM